jgi:hypothetical protein
VQTCFRGKALATLKNLYQKIFDENFERKPVFKEIILHNKNFWTKKCLMKFLSANLFSRKLFCNLKNFSAKKCLMKILGASLFSRFATIKKICKRFVNENFGSIPVFEETILQP